MCLRLCVFNFFFFSMFPLASVQWGLCLSLSRLELIRGGLAEHTHSIVVMSHSGRHHYKLCFTETNKCSTHTYLHKHTQICIYVWPLWPPVHQAFNSVGVWPFSLFRCHLLLKTQTWVSQQLYITAVHHSWMDAWISICHQIMPEKEFWSFTMERNHQYAVIIFLPLLFFPIQLQMKTIINEL